MIAFSGISVDQYSHILRYLETYNVEFEVHEQKWYDFKAGFLMTGWTTLEDEEDLLQPVKGKRRNK